MHRLLPDVWKPMLREYLKERFQEDRDDLSASDFQSNVQIRFPDGSHVFFRAAFYLLSRERNEIAVYTEHCGYHIFPLAGAELELFKSEWTDLGSA